MNDFVLYGIFLVFGSLMLGYVIWVIFQWWKEKKGVFG